MKHPKIHIIERRSDWYAPSLPTIRRILALAKAAGFRSDWDYCGVLEDGALSFGSSGDNLKVNLIAVRVRRGKYEFMTEREYLNRPLPTVSAGER